MDRLNPRTADLSEKRRRGRGHATVYNTIDVFVSNPLHARGVRFRTTLGESLGGSLLGLLEILEMQLRILQSTYTDHAETCGVGKKLEAKKGRNAEKC